jgi:hypothetical protein
MKRPSSSNHPHHFLFMLPASTTPSEQDEIVETAKKLTSMGYVYVASAHERTMEDRDNIRFMPLKNDDLPCFNAVAGVMVVRDQGLAEVAQHAYPGANILVIDPAQPAQHNKVDHGQLLPWVATQAMRKRAAASRAMTPAAA